jgi:hypothetical protein
MKKEERRKKKEERRKKKEERRKKKEERIRNSVRVNNIKSGLFFSLLPSPFFC